MIALVVCVFTSNLQSIKYISNKPRDYCSPSTDSDVSNRSPAIQKKILKKMLFDLTGYVLEKSRYFVKSSMELFYFTVCREKALRTLNCFTAQTLINYPCSISLYCYTIIACNTFFKSL